VGWGDRLVVGRHPELCKNPSLAPLVHAALSDVPAAPTDAPVEWTEELVGSGHAVAYPSEERLLVSTGERVVSIGPSRDIVDVPGGEDPELPELAPWTNVLVLTPRTPLEGLGSTVLAPHFFVALSERGVRRVSLVPPGRDFATLASWVSTEAGWFVYSLSHDGGWEPPTLVDLWSAASWVAGDGAEDRSSWPPWYGGLRSYGFGASTPTHVVFALGSRGGGHGVEPYATPGPEGELALLADVYPGEGSSDPAAVGHAGGITFFAATTPGEGRELWATDGTPEGTLLLADAEVGPAGIDPTWASIAGGRVVVRGTSPSGADAYYVLSPRP